MNRFIEITAAVLITLSFPTAGLSSVGLDDEEVVFRLGISTAERVFLVGDFNGWNPTVDRMLEKEDGYEIRLFLVPGRYRYMFVVDGVSRPDPDNPYRDGDGYSYFIFRESEGGYEIAFSGGIDRLKPFERTEVAISGEADLVADNDKGSLFFRGEARGVLDESGEALLSVGYEYEASGRDTGKGKSYLLRGSASYRSERGDLRAFNRSGQLEQEDPLEIFGSVGPFDYPLGLFCRGVSCEGRIIRGIRGRLFYASRIDGYRTGLEKVQGDVTNGDAANLFGERELEDSDLIGARVGGRFGFVELGYLYRRDSRPRGGEWRLSRSDGDLYRGFERARFSGAWMTIWGERDVKLKAEYLKGGSYLSSIEKASAGDDFKDFEVENDWERGYRFYTGIEYGAERLRLMLALTRTTIEGDRFLREGRPGGSLASLGGLLETGTDDLGFRLEGKVESFSGSNRGEVFWFQRRNFWLDGDKLTAGHLPFLESREIYEVRLAFRFGEGEKATVRPYNSGFRLSLFQRGERSDRGSRMTEVILTKGISLTRWLTLFVDMRYASYRHEEWAGKRDFFDTFIAFQYRIGSSSWCSLGAGVNPCSFDRWLYAFSNHGRESYLLDTGLFDDLETSSRADVMKALREAERSLSEEWMIAFEACTSF